MIKVAAVYLLTRSPMRTRYKDFAVWLCYLHLSKRKTEPTKKYQIELINILTQLKKDITKYLMIACITNCILAFQLFTVCRKYTNPVIGHYVLLSHALGLFLMKLHVSFLIIILSPLVGKSLAKFWSLCMTSLLGSPVSMDRALEVVKHRLMISAGNRGHI